MAMQSFPPLPMFTGEESGPVGHSKTMSLFDKFVPQVNAMAMQSFLPLSMFTGEDIDSDEKIFDKWLERFEERASLAGWTDEQRFHQFKVRLDKSALHVFGLVRERAGCLCLSSGSIEKALQPH